MSELVEKVARAMNEGEDGDLSPTDKWLARAAIAAVAEWFDTQGDEQWYPGERLREQLEGMK